MSLVGAIGSVGTSKYTVTRTADGSLVKGVYTPGAPSTFEIEAHVQPATSGNFAGRLLEALPEGQRGKEILVIYTMTELKTRTPTSEPDIIAINGEDWIVFRVETWTAFGETHYRAFASRREVP